MRFTAYATGLTPPAAITLTASSNGTLVWSATTTADAPVAYTFGQTGTYSVCATFSGTQSSIITVKVKDASFGSSVNAYVNSARDWALPDIGTDLVINWDSSFIVSEYTPPANGGRKVSLRPTVSGTDYVVARLSQQGAILATGTVVVARTFDAVETGDGYIATTFDNGDRTVDATIVIDQLPPGGYAEVRIFVAGVTFADGTIVKRLYASDFDAFGVAHLVFNYPVGTPSGTCHHIYIFDAQGNQVGVMP